MSPISSFASLSAFQTLALTIVVVVTTALTVGGFAFYSAFCHGLDERRGMPGIGIGRLHFHIDSALAWMACLYFLTARWSGVDRVSVKAAIVAGLGSGGAVMWLLHFASALGSDSATKYKRTIDCYNASPTDDLWFTDFPACPLQSKSAEPKSKTAQP